MEADSQTTQQIIDYIAAAPEPQRDILIVLRNMIRTAVPDAQENFKWGRPVYSASKDFCYITYAKNHGTLGFFKFAGLHDPTSRLEGTGKDMRHVKIKSEAEIDHVLFTSWLQHSSTLS